MVTGQPVIGEVLRVLPWTIELTVVSLLIGIALGVPVGVYEAIHRNRFVDYAMRISSLLGLSFPPFVAAIILLLLFAIAVPWFPVISARSGSVGAWFQSITLPAVSLGLISAAYVTRVTRSAMLEVLSEDYVRTARAKGVPWQAVIWRHALRNALIPIITLGALEFGTLLSGAVLTEQVFTIPGFGKLIVDAVFNRDYAVVQGVVLFTATAYIVLNLLADIAYAIVNPRIRVQ